MRAALACALVPALVPALVLPGCGYGLVGRGANVAADIKKIGVPLFKDVTGKAGLDQKVTQQVMEELLKRGRLDVVQTAAGVDAVVEGELTAYSLRPVGFSAEGEDRQAEASRYSITLTARVRYARAGQDEPIWASDAFAFTDVYDLGNDPGAYFDREEQALDRLVAAFARSLVAAMLEAF